MHSANDIEIGDGFPWHEHDTRENVAAKASIQFYKEIIEAPRKKKIMWTPASSISSIITNNGNQHTATPDNHRGRLD